MRLSRNEVAKAFAVPLELLCAADRWSVMHGRPSIPVDVAAPVRLTGLVHGALSPPPGSPAATPAAVAAALGAPSFPAAPGIRHAAAGPAGRGDVAVDVVYPLSYLPWSVDVADTDADGWMLPASAPAQSVAQSAEEEADAPPIWGATGWMLHTLLRQAVLPAAALALRGPDATQGHAGSGKAP